MPNITPTQPSLLVSWDTFDDIGSKELNEQVEASRRLMAAQSSDTKSPSLASRIYDWTKSATSWAAGTHAGAVTELAVPATLMRRAIEQEGWVMGGLIVGPQTVKWVKPYMPYIVGASSVAATTGTYIIFWSLEKGAGICQQAYRGHQWRVFQKEPTLEANDSIDAFDSWDELGDDFFIKKVSDQKIQQEPGYLSKAWNWTKWAAGFGVKSQTSAAVNGLVPMLIFEANPWTAYTVTPWAYRGIEGFVPYIASGVGDVASWGTKKLLNSAENAFIWMTTSSPLEMPPTVEPTPSPVPPEVRAAVKAHILRNHPDVI